MQRQDGHDITQNAIMLFIAQMLSLADVMMEIVAGRRHVDDQLMRHLVLSEQVMMMTLTGLLTNADTRCEIRRLAAQRFNEHTFVLPPGQAARRDEALYIAMSLRQIAAHLALLLAMNPRAFRDRFRLFISALQIEAKAAAGLYPPVANARALDKFKRLALARAPP